METLDLSNNELGFISEGGFEGLSNVSTLKLNNNGAYDPEDTSIDRWYNRLLRIEDGAFRHMPLLGFLDLSNSGVRNITDGTFSGGLVHLETIHLGSQAYMGMGAALRVSPGAFGHLPGLKDLDLSDNIMFQEDFEPGLFRNCSSLTRLDLRSNRLTTLSAETFAGLQGSLVRLFLSSNRITSVSLGALSGFDKLSEVSLEYNRLAILPLEVFGDMGSGLAYDSGAYVSLEGNPLVCAPRAPTGGRGYIYFGWSMSASSLPQCPSEVLTFICSPAVVMVLTLCGIDVLAGMQAALY
jgi:hypothetical protein